MKDEEDPRTKRVDICGAIMRTEKIEWICIKQAHAKIYQRRSRNRGEVIFSDNPNADRHYFVNRYPYTERFSV